MIGYELRIQENGKSRLCFREMDFMCAPLYTIDNFKYSNDKKPSFSFEQVDEDLSKESFS